MRSKSGFISSLLLTAALAAPVAIMAAAKPQEASVQVRVYDKNHKDYHNWDDNENRAWGQFLVVNHRDHHEYAKSNKKEQGEYWDWRHAHPDGNNIQTGLSGIAGRGGLQDTGPTLNP